MYAVIASFKYFIMILASTARQIKWERIRRNKNNYYDDVNMENIENS